MLPAHRYQLVGRRERPRTENDGDKHLKGVNMFSAQLEKGFKHYRSRAFLFGSKCPICWGSSGKKTCLSKSLFRNMASPKMPVWSRFLLLLLPAAAAQLLVQDWRGGAYEAPKLEAPANLSEACRYVQISPVALEGRAQAASWSDNLRQRDIQPKNKLSCSAPGYHHGPTGSYRDTT